MHIKVRKQTNKQKVGKKTKQVCESIKDIQTVLGLTQSLPLSPFQPEAGHDGPIDKLDEALESDLHS